MLRAPNGVAEDSMKLLERGQGLVRSRKIYRATCCFTPNGTRTFRATSRTAISHS